MGRPRLIQVANDERSKRKRRDLIARRAMQAQKYERHLDKARRFGITIVTDEDLRELEELP